MIYFGSDFDSYARHVIWRYEYLGIGPEQVSKNEKEILNRYLLGAKTLGRKEVYETGIYIRDIENKIAYHTDEYQENEIEETEEEKPKTKVKRNQILSAIEEMEKKQNK